MKPIIVCLGILLYAVGVNAQSVSADTIFKRNKEVLLVKITEIGIDEVKYKPLVNPNDIVLVLAKSEIERIIFAGGVVQTFADPMTDKTLYAGNRANSLKFNFLSPIGDRVHLNWEHTMMPGVSYEVGVNVIGLGQRFGRSTPVGAILNGGMRFYRLPDVKSRSDRYSHLMNGAYFQPTLAFGMTRHYYKSYETAQGPYGTYVPDYSKYTDKPFNTKFLMFFLNFGRQYVFANRLSFEMSAGVGYGTYSESRRQNYGYYEYTRAAYTSDEDPTRFGFVIFDRTVPLALNAQFKLGYLFK